MPDIEQKEIPEKYIATLRDNKVQLHDKLFELPVVQKIEKHIAPAFDYTKSFWQRLRAFIKAENELGRAMGIVLDIWGFLDPRVKDARDYIRKHIIPKI